MNNKTIDNILQAMKRRRTWRRIVSILSAIVLLITVNQVTFLADTLARIPTCGIEEHIHDVECYNEFGDLVCNLDEHVHTDACYQERPKTVESIKTAVAETDAQDLGVDSEVASVDIELPAEEIGEISLDELVPDANDSYEETVVIEPTLDVGEDFTSPSYDINGGSYVLFSDILASLYPQINVDDVEDVGESILYDDQPLSISAEKMDGDFGIRMLRDFIDDDMVELCFFTKDGGVYILNLKNGVVPVEASESVEVEVEQDGEQVAQDIEDAVEVHKEDTQVSESNDVIVVAATEVEPVAEAEEELINSAGNAAEGEPEQGDDNEDEPARKEQAEIEKTTQEDAGTVSKVDGDAIEVEAEIGDEGKDKDLINEENVTRSENAIEVTTEGYVQVDSPTDESHDTVTNDSEIIDQYVDSTTESAVVNESKRDSDDDSVEETEVPTENEDVFEGEAAGESENGPADDKELGGQADIKTVDADNDVLAEGDAVTVSGEDNSTESNANDEDSREVEDVLVSEGGENADSANEDGAESGDKDSDKTVDNNIAESDKDSDAVVEDDAESDAMDESETKDNADTEGDEAAGGISEADAESDATDKTSDDSEDKAEDNDEVTVEDNGDTDTGRGNEESITLTAPYTTEIDVAGLDVPYSLNAMMTEVKGGEAAALKAVYESVMTEEVTAELEAVSADSEGSEEDEDPVITYDAELISIEAVDGDYLVTPIAPFEETIITVQDEDTYIVTLRNYSVETEPETIYPAQGFEAHIEEGMIVSVTAPDGAFPEGTTMEVAPVYDEATLTSIACTVEEEGTTVKHVSAVDITFRDAEGQEIEPLVPISVVMSVEELKQSNDAVVVHMDNDGNTEVVDQTESGETEVAFDAEAFSVYAVVITERYISASGETYQIQVSYDSNAGIPEGATLKVEEVDASQYLEIASDAIGEDKAVKLARFFDITIMAEGREIQPDDSVTVKVTLDDAVEADEVKAVHFADEDVTVLAAEEADGVVTFSAESFSVYGIVYTVDFEYENRHTELLGNEETTLSELLRALDAGVEISDVESVECAGNVVLCEALENDWRIRMVPNTEDTGSTLTIKTPIRCIEIAVTLTGRKTLELGNTTISAANGLYLPEDAEGYSRDSEDAAAAVSAVEAGFTDAPTQAEAALLNREYRVYDIGLINVDPEDYPAGFEVRIALGDAPKNENLQLFHIHEGEVSEIADFTVEDDVLTFVTDGFSEFVLYGYDAKTTTFEWTNNTVSLKDLLGLVGLTGVPKSVTTSDHTLLTAAAVEGEGGVIADWTIEKLDDYTKEYLYLTFEDDLQVTLSLEGNTVSIHKVYSLSNEDGQYAVSLKALLAALGISSENISQVSFSNPSQMTVNPVSDGETITDWLLKKLGTFASQEYLTVEYSDGSQITLSVKDDQVSVINDAVSIKILDGWTRTEDGAYVWEAAEYPAGHDFTFRVNYSFSSDTVYKTRWEPGQIEMRLPGTALIDRDGNPADEFHISLPRDDDPTLTARNVFVYRLEGNDIVVYNRVPAAPAEVGYFEISYSTDKTTFDYADFGKGQNDRSREIGVTLTIYGEDDDGNVYRQNTHTQKQDGLIVVGVDTTAEVTRVEKRDPKKYESWQSGWGIEPEAMEDPSTENPSYIYLVWTVKSTLEATQPFDFCLDDSFNVPHGEVVGYRLTEHPLYGDEASAYYNHPTNYIPASAGGNVIKNMTLPLGTATRTDYVLTRIEKEYYYDYLLGEGKDKGNQQSFFVNNTVTASVTPADGVDAPTTATGSAPYTDKRSSFHVGGGGFSSDKKGLTTSQALSRFNADSTNTLSGLRYQAWMDGSTYPYTYLYDGEGTDPGADTEAGQPYYGKKPVTFTLSDNNLWIEYFDYEAYKEDHGATIESGAEDEYTKTTLRLTKDDYRIDLVDFSCVFKDAAYSEISKEVYGGSNLTAEQIAAAVNAGRIGDLVFTLENNDDAVEGSISYDFTTKTFTGFGEAANYLDGSQSGEGKLVFASGSNITGFAMSNDNSRYYTRLEARPSVTLKHGDIVDGVLQKIKEYKESGASYQFKLWNQANYSARQDETTLYTYTRSGRDFVLGDTGSSEIIKRYTTRRNDTVNNRYLIDWYVTMDETFTASGIDYPVEQAEGGVFYDLLPLSAEYLGGTLTVLADGRQLNASQYALTVNSNYNNTGRAMMRVEVKEPGEVYELSYTTALSWDSILEQRRGSTVVQAHNAVSYTKSGEDGIGRFADSGEGLTVEDSDNLDTLGKEGFTISTTYDCPVTALVSGTLGLQKLVRATEGEQYDKEAETISGGEYSYLLRFGPNAGTKARDLVVFDFLETYPGTQWTGSLLSVDTSLAVAMGADPVVYYSTMPRDIFTNNNVQDARDNTSDSYVDDYQGLAEAGIEHAEYNNGTTWVKVWSSTPPSNLSDVTAVAVDLRKATSTTAEDGEHFVLREGKTISVTIYMQAPTGAVMDGEEVIPVARTYNSMYLQNDTVDEGIAFTGVPDVRLEEHTQVTYKLVGNLSLHKVDAESTTQPVKGVEFRLTGISAYGTEVDVAVTSDINGSVNFRNLELTRADSPYRLWEVGGNPDYQVDNAVYLASVNADGSVTLSTENGDPLPETITRLKEGDYQYRVDNKPRAHGDLSFTKKGKVDGTTELKELEGASFSLTSDPVSEYGNFIEMFAVSDHEGTVTFENIEWGRYILAEIAPADGYTLANRTFAVTVDGDGVVSMELIGEAEESDNVVFEKVETSEPGAEYKEYDYVLTDEPLHSLGLYKVDAMDNTQLEGAVFQISGTSIYGHYTEVSATSDSAGLVRFDDLEPGTYSMRETVAPTRPLSDATVNYELDPTVYEVQIGRDGAVDIRYIDADGVERTMTNVVEVEGEGKIIALDGNHIETFTGTSASERYFHAGLGLFNMPNEPSKDGKLSVEKIWLGTDGITELTNITSRPVPVVHVDTEIPVKTISAARINKNLWDANKGSFNSVTAVAKADSAHKPTSADNATDEGWIKISENSEDYPDNIFVKVIDGVLYVWSDSVNVFLPVNCEQMFYQFGNLVTFDSSIFKTDQVTSMKQMFRECGKLNAVDMEKWNLMNVLSFQEMFSNCDHLTSTGNIYINGANAIVMRNMFDLGTSLQKARIINVNSAGGGRVDIHCMFRKQWNLQTVQFVNFMNVEADSSMQDVFSPFNDVDMHLKSVDFGGLKTDNVKDMKNLFYRCVDLRYVDLTSFDTHSVSSNVDTNMFKNCNISVNVDESKWTLLPAKIFPNSNCTLTYGTYTGAFTPVHYPATTSTTVLTSDPTSVSMVTDSANPVVSKSSLTEAELEKTFDQWIYDSATGHWNYNFHVVPSANQRYYVWEEATDNLSDWIWVEGESDPSYVVLDYSYSNETNTATVRNRKKTEDTVPDDGDLIVGKKVTGDALGSHGNDEFTFKVLVNGEVQRINGSDTFTLKSGQTQGFYNLPAGASYQVIEVAKLSGYGDPTVNGDAMTYVEGAGYSTGGTIDANAQVFVQVENPLIPTTGDLTITKRAVAAEGVTDLDPDALYEFTVRLWTQAEEAGETVKTPLTGSGYGIALNANGEAVKRIKADESIHLTNLPAGTRYTVTETALENYSTVYTRTVNGTVTEGNTGVITAGVEDEVTCTNTKTQNDETGGFILKKVLGENTETAEAFTFNIVFGNLGDQKRYTYRVTDGKGTDDPGDDTFVDYPFTSGADGAYTATLSLTANQAADFAKLPVGATYRITEAASGNFIASYALENTRDDGGSIIGVIAQTGGRNTAANTPLATATETVNSNERTTVTFTNTEALQSVKIIKKDATDESALPGAELGIYRVTVSREGNIETLVGAEMRVATLYSSSSAQSQSLHSGSYVLRELTPPTGYMTAKDIRFDLSEEGVLKYWSVDTTTHEEVTTYTPVVEGSVTEGQAKSLEIEMLDEPTAIQVLKVDPAGQPVSGAMLAILTAGESSSVVDTWVTDETGARTLTAKLRLDGAVTDEGVATGTKYILREVRAPAMYDVAKSIYFVLRETDEGVEIYTSDTADGHYTRLEDAENNATLTLSMVDTPTEFTFSKRWRALEGEAWIEWEADQSITVNILRGSSASDENPEIYETYTVAYADLTADTEINGTRESGLKLTVTYAVDKLYTFKVTGLPRYGENGEQYTWFVSEEQPLGCQPPQYYETTAAEEAALGASRTGNGGMIVNRDGGGFELPSTGGPGPTLYTVSGLSLVLLAVALLLRKKRQY